MSVYKNTNVIDNIKEYRNLCLKRLRETTAVNCVLQGPMEANQSTKLKNGLAGEM